MEEIDYHWKCQMKGHEIWVEPAAVIYHKGAVTLPVSSPRKTYLNYRNNLLLLLTNYPPLTSFRLFFPRIFLELISFLNEIFTFRGTHALAILQSWVWIIFHPGIILSRRRQIENFTVSDQIYERSIVKKYFIQGKNKFLELNSNPS